MANKNNSLSQDDLREVQDAVAYVAERDIHVGRALNLLAASLARLNNVEYPVPAPEPQVEQAPAEQAPAQEGV